MQKIIHYCWFGGKPLPKLAKKCIKSWRKYLPDYEIKEWNEKNFDLNLCPFVKEAYENKKWAFVSDYARLYALYNYGGIYFDTDMEIIANPKELLEKEIFIGYEENKMIAAGVIGVKEKENKHIKELIDFYNEKTEFNNEQIFNYAIPKIISNIWGKYKKVNTDNNIDIIDNSIYVYPEEYFYPINYDYSHKNYTRNTCMVHYYNASWTPKSEKIAIGFYRIFGNKWGRRLLNIFYKLCGIKNRLINYIRKKISYTKMFLSIHLHRKKRVNSFEKSLKDIKENYIVISHPDWMGLKNSALENFENIVFLREQYTIKEAKNMAETINNSHKKVIIFNGFAYGWKNIAEEIKQLNNSIIIKVIWHGSNALLSECYDYEVFMQIIDLHNRKIIDEIGFVKKSMYEFYRRKNFRCSFIMNTINISNPDRYKDKKDNQKVKIGLYASGDRWVKNTYNQLSAASLIENAIIDCVPMSHKISNLASIFNVEITGSTDNISREELFKHLASNDINLYVTFTECAPLLPLESLELGVPCITGDNHHYFEGTELEKYLVVSKEDNIIEIYEKIKYVLENREKIIELYTEWKKQYFIKAKESIMNFIDM